ncbi:hypothetical protein BX600DRAFT_380652 [Xylariales sp. PMI_506]|nr:hypothetical protein BX600DRAFT_380652 [Xylariales sp. PMI_506]
MSAPPNNLTDFPNVEAKLQKAPKQSAFEKQKAEAEAKRKREAAETAAVYESFVKSFDHDDDDDDQIRAIAQGAPFNRSSGLGGVRGGGGGGPGGRRHFGAGLKSGPGSLGPAPASGFNQKSGPGSLGPLPTSYGRSRGHDGGFQRDYGRRDDGSGGRLTRYDDDRERLREHDPPPSKTISKAFDTSDDEGEGRTAGRAEERAVAKPTLRLANLPLGTSPALIKSLIPTNLTVENVKILPPSGLGPNERKFMAAIVVLSPETPAADMDAAVSSLQNRYLGYGFYLNIHRHLSSVVSSSVAASSLASTASSQPFGAKPVAQPSDQNTHRQNQFHRGYAPPSSYGAAGGGPISRTALLHVPVQAPRDIKQLQLIHRVIESVLEHGPEFEALLMSRPDVQREEKWAWLWNARSEGGVWYRWHLWEIITGSQANGGKRGKYLPLFEGSHAWKAPEKPLLYEYNTKIDEFVSDPEYNSSDDDDDFDDDGHKQNEGATTGADTENTYLNPLDKAKLVHLLARLPTTISRLRKGDIARVTTFAITHASRGADEIVELIVSNVRSPFSFTSANPRHKNVSKSENDDNGAGSNPSTPPPTEDKDKTGANEQVDTSGASLVGLYVVSDILSSSATSGVRHSWRYRQLFESALRERNIFEHLGLAAERLGWGRLRSDKWKRSIGLVLSLWEGWCVFPAESQEMFVRSFESPPSLAAKKGVLQSEDATVEDTVEKKRRWKTVEAGAAEGGKGFKPVSTIDLGGGYNPSAMEVDEIDGEAMEEDIMEDEPMDSDIDGIPMDSEPDDNGVEVEPMDEDPPSPHPPILVPPPLGLEPPRESKDTIATGERLPRRRMRAVDMFADDGSEKEDK